jgi:capsular exopolysaccharide synthesis family protein
MKDLTPMPPADPGFQLMSPMESAPATPPPSKLRWHKVWFFLRAYWWIPLTTVSLSLVVAVITFLLMPPVFVSSGSLWEAEKMRLPDGAAFTQDRENYLGTQAQLLRSPTLRQLTLNWMRANGTNNIMLGEDGEPLPVEIEVYYTSRSSVYTIEARSLNPAFTPIYLNALMKQYLEFRRNSRREVSSDILSAISEQVQKLERALKADQTALETYERTNNFAVLQEESAAEGRYLTKLKTELSDYQLQMSLLDDAAINQHSSHSTVTNSTDSLLERLSNTDPAASAGRLEAARQVELLKTERAKLSKYLRPEHPKIAKLDENIARSQQLIDLYNRQNQEQIATMLAALQLKITNVQSFIKQWEAKVLDSSARLAAANSLKQAIARNQAMFDRLRGMLDNVDISRNIDQDTLSILMPADPSKRSYKEARTLGTQAGLIGVALGLGIICFMALRDDRFASLVEVTETFGDNVVGQVPEIPELGHAGEAPLALLQSNDDRHMYAESYRNLRSALLYLSVDGQRPRVLLITSAVPNEGKSTVAANLARAMALGGSKVLLVDADLRKGHIHERLKLKSKPGLTELLRQSHDWNQVIQPTDLADFSFLARGAICHNPGDLFLNPAFDTLLGRLRERFDYVIIDSSPVFAADDSSTLAPKVDGTLFVVRSRFSNARAVREALNLLFQRQARVLGLILNRADTTTRSYHAYKYAEYYAEASKAAAEAEEKA